MQSLRPNFLSDTNDWGRVWRLRFSNKLLVQKIPDILFYFWVQWSRNWCVLLLHLLASFKLISISISGIQSMSCSLDENDSNPSLNIILATICWSWFKPLRSTAERRFMPCLSCFPGVSDLVHSRGSWVSRCWYTNEVLHPLNRLSASVTGLTA